jgi:DNA-binding transcriptional regulator YdaS (Cro superfamily)
MNPISKYLHDTGMSQAEFAKGIKVSQGMVHQYTNGLRPVSEKVCVRIEDFTGRRLSRKALRPKDWREIWPELAKEPAHV